MNAEQTPPNDFPESPEPLAPPEELHPTLWQALRGPIREIIETIFITLVIFLLIRIVIQNFRVEGFSMEPNFHDGQFLLVSKIEYMFHAPQRGDIVVFRYPLQPTRDFIKRIIGVPGDQVDIKNSQIFVNGEPLHEGYPLNLGSYNYGPMTMGVEEYFVLGDNRNNSSDSHSWGMLPVKNIIGKAWFSYWPPQWFGLVQQFSYASDQ